MPVCIEDTRNERESDVNNNTFTQQIVTVAVVRGHSTLVTDTNYDKSMTLASHKATFFLKYIWSVTDDRASYTNVRDKILLTDYRCFVRQAFQLLLPHPNKNLVRIVQASMQNKQ